MNFHGAVWQLVSRVVLDANVTRESVRDLVRACADDWTRIVRLADFAMVTPALCVNLERLDVLDMAPPEARHYLATVKRMNLARNQALEAQLDETIRALNAAAIVPTLLKGAAHLKLGIFEHPASRMTTDLDLFVAKDRLLEAQRALSALGYEPVPDKNMNYATHHHTPPLCRTGEYASIELHEEPLHWRARGCLDASELEAKSIERGVSGFSYRTPCASHAVLLAIAHSEIVNRNFEQFVVDLRALRDVGRLQAAFGERIDWLAIEERFRREGHAHVLRAFVFIMQKLARIERNDHRVNLRSRLRYFGCRVALRHGWLRPWIRRAELLTTARIRSRIGPGHNWLAINRHRVATLFAMLDRGKSKMMRRLSGRFATDRKSFDEQQPPA